MNLAVNGLRLMGKRCGVGRYLEYLLRGWDGLEHPFERILVYTPGELEEPIALPRDAEVRIIRAGESPTYWEQVALPQRHRAGDLLFCPSYVIPLAARGRVVLTHHGSYEALPDAFPWFERVKSRWVYQLSARRASLVITVSESSKADIMRYYGVGAEKIRVIPNGVDPTFRPRPDPAAARQTRLAYLGADRPFLLFVGKLSRRRNLPQLVAAFAQVKTERGLPHALLVIGPDPLGQDVPRLAREQGVGDAVRYREFASHVELVRIYNAAELFVYPSSYEGFGLPVLEAMACGLPAIALRNSAFLEFAEGAAHLAADGSVAELARAITEVLSSPGRRAQMRAAGLRRAADFSWNAVARETLATLAEVASR